MFSPHMSKDAFGGLLFLVIVGGIGINHLYDEGYRTWAVVGVSASLYATTTAFFGLILKGSIVALLILVVALPVAWFCIMRGNPKTPPNPP